MHDNQTFLSGFPSAHFATIPLIWSNPSSSTSSESGRIFLLLLQHQQQQLQLWNIHKTVTHFHPHPRTMLRWRHWQRREAIQPHHHPHHPPPPRWCPALERRAFAGPKDELTHFCYPTQYHLRESAITGAESGSGWRCGDQCLAIS